MRGIVTLATTAVVVAMAGSAAAQATAEVGRSLLERPAVKAALAAARQNEPQIIEQQVAVCEIPAPEFKEGQRAQALEQRFAALGLQNVHIDKAGNVVGDRPGAAAHPHLVFAAHLDTVFPEGTPVKTTREGNVIKGPGIGDDCRGLAVMLGVIRALRDGQVRTPGTITFVANVGEEGLGDLRGVKYLFNESLKGQIDDFVSVDGTGYGITNVGVGSHRYRVTYKGPGGHSYGAFGLANPIHALGRAVAQIADFQVPREPKTTFNVGRIGGGTSVNSIAYEAWMEMDMRSADDQALRALDDQFQKAVDRALVEENDRWGGNGRLTVSKQLVGDRPAGQTPESSPIVQAAVSVTRALDLPYSLDAGSTDSNLPMSLHIPAITIDGGGTGHGGHSLAESFDTTDSWKGTARALLVAVALVQH